VDYLTILSAARVQSIKQMDDTNDHFKGSNTCLKRLRKIMGGKKKSVRKADIPVKT
jgi:hypothetical protein